MVACSLFLNILLFLHDCEAGGVIGVIVPQLTTTNTDKHKDEGHLRHKPEKSHVNPWWLRVFQGGGKLLYLA